MPTKQALRTEMRAERDALSPEFRREASAAVCATVADLVLGDGAPDGYVLTYAAFGSELDLGELHDRLFAAGASVALPRVEGRQMVAVPYRSGAGLVASRFGVPEPTGSAISPGRIAVVVAPGLSFDRRGVRLGYGAGYYDRYLPLVAPRTPVIGVCFAAQLHADDLPCEAHDRRVARVVTELGVIEPAA